MSLLVGESFGLWRHLVKSAEDQCAIQLQSEVESYLITLLTRYIDKPDVVKQVFATAFLETLHLKNKERHHALQYVGDGCLLFAGLFPKAAERKHVKINYFVDLGRSAYSGISHATNDLYARLAIEFVSLMDILQTIKNPTLLPLEAYEQWHEVGSQRALKVLQEYADGLPVWLGNK